jgi:hypothetical protein
MSACHSPFLGLLYLELIPYELAPFTCFPRGFEESDNSAASAQQVHLRVLFDIFANSKIFLLREGIFIDDQVF